MKGVARQFKPDHPRRIDRYIDYFAAQTSSQRPTIREVGDVARGTSFLVNIDHSHDACANLRNQERRSVIEGRRARPWR